MHLRDQIVINKCLRPDQTCNEFNHLHPDTDGDNDKQVSMSDSDLLDAVLSSTQIPHQPFVIVVDSAAFSGLTLFQESLQKALSRCAASLYSMMRIRADVRGGSVLRVNVLPGSSSSTRLNETVLDLGVPGFNAQAEDVVKRISSACAYSSSFSILILI